MKTLVLALVFALLGSTTDAFGASSVNPIQREEFVVTVTRVFAARDEGATYRAYLVKWKNQDVVVIDNLLQTDCKVGDKLRIFAVKHPPPGVIDGRRSIAFAIAPKSK